MQRCSSGACELEITTISHACGNEVMNSLVTDVYSLQSTPTVGSDRYDYGQNGLQSGIAQMKMKNDRKWKNQLNSLKNHDK